MAAPPVVIAAGSATDIGTAHGEGLRAQIHDHLTRWKQALERAHGVDADRLIAGFVAAGGFRAAVERYTPWLIDEIDGIATGADLSNAETWFLQLMDESWQQQSLFRREHCTAFGVVDGMRSWGVRFFDAKGQTHWVTVNDMLPTVPGDNTKLAYGGPADKSLNGEIWVPLLEKAYAQANTLGILPRSENKGKNSFMAVEGGGGDPIVQMQGGKQKCLSV